MCFVFLFNCTMSNLLTFTFTFFFYTSSSSVVCNVQSCHLGPETTPSLPGLACPGWRDRPGLVVPSSPFPLLTGLGLLLETITGIHKGLSCKVVLTEIVEILFGSIIYDAMTGTDNNKLRNTESAVFSMNLLPLLRTSSAKYEELISKVAFGCSLLEV